MATAANSTSSFAGYLDGEMDSKGICFSPLVDTECQRISGLVLGALLRARERDSLPPASASCSALLAPSATLHSSVFLFQVPAIEENLLDDKHLLKPWDAKKVDVARCPSSFHGQAFRGPCGALSSFFSFFLLSSAVLILFPPSVLRSPWN